MFEVLLTFAGYSMAICVVALPLAILGLIWAKISKSLDKDSGIRGRVGDHSHTGTTLKRGEDNGDNERN